MHAHHLPHFLLTTSDATFHPLLFLLLTLSSLFLSSFSLVISLTRVLCCLPGLYDLRQNYLYIQNVCPSLYSPPIAEGEGDAITSSARYLVGAANSNFDLQVCITIIGLPRRPRIPDF